MELTPIKIPGARNRERNKKATASRKSLKRPPGRPFKLPPSPDRLSTTAVEDMPLKKKSKKRSLKYLLSWRKMSALEKLPTELLESVFLYSMNIDLPRSSPILAGKLCSQLIYIQTIVTVFDRTWNRTLQLPHPHGDGDGGGALDHSRYTTIQSSILRCRWASVPIILKAKDRWLQARMQNNVFSPVYFRKDDPETGNSRRTVQTSSETFFNEDFKDFSDFALEQEEVRDFSSAYSWDTTKDVESRVEIPSSLLLGPWTEDMVKYLFWVTKSGAEIDFVNSTNGEVAMEGLRNAIVLGDTRVIHLLKWAGLQSRMDIDIIIWALRTVRVNRLAVMNHLLLLGFQPLLDKDARKLGKALREMRDEAVAKSDRNQLDFIKAVLRSHSFRESTNLHV